MRKMVFYIYEDIEYGIYEKDRDFPWLSNEGKKDVLNVYDFATYRVKDDKILGFFDVNVSDKKIELAKKDKLMQEMCEFECEGTDIKFVGTFVDVLKYIQKRMNEILKDK